jgi:hypothetical protein
MASGTGPVLMINLSYAASPPMAMAIVTQSFVSTVTSSRSAQYDHVARIHH